MKKTISLFLLLCAVLFTSCENFLNGSDVLATGQQFEIVKKGMTEMSLFD